MSARVTRLVAGVATLGIVTAACAGSASGPPAGGAPIVVATTTIWADVARNVGCNDLATVETIIPAGADPHEFEASLKDRETMDHAALIVANGLSLEESMVDMIATVESDGVRVVRVGDHVDTLPIMSRDNGDTSGAQNPHIWFDPTRVAQALPAIADALVGAGVDRAALDACVTDYTARLTALDAEVAAIVAPLPVDQRLLVTNHDSLGYFADRYDFEILGSVIPSPSSLSATNPAELQALAKVIADTGVPAIFAETQHSSTDTEALAERVGNVEVVTLQTDTLGEPGSDTGTYVDWLTTTARSIVGALTPGS